MPAPDATPPATEGSACFHCGQPVPTEVDLQVEIDGQARPMCCAGCQAVAQAIVDNHLEDFYRHRTEVAPTPEALIPEALREFEVYDNPALQQSFVHRKEGELREASLILEGIVCAACVWLNERHVGRLPGVHAFYVNYATHRAQVVWDDSRIHLSDILKAISAIGYRAHPYDPQRQEAVQKKERSRMLRRIGIAGVGAMQVMMMAVAMYLGDYQGMDAHIRNLLRWASLAITLPVIGYSGQAFFLSAWRDLRRRRLGMDVPVAIALGSAFLASAWHTALGRGEVYYDSVTMFIFFLLIGRFLEMTARHRAGQVAEELVKLMPAVAHRQTEDGSLQEVPVAELRPGDRVVVKPGEPVPADGTVLAGRSSVDESLLTGESLPVDKAPGAPLVGGTLNVASPLTLRVERVGQDTVLAGISRLLERAQEEKPQIARLANRVAGWFVAGLLAVAALVFGWWAWQTDAGEAFRITLSVLVVTCPCALSLATPVALTAATGALTRVGMLTTRGHALETLAQATDIVFDKTGTLTRGQLRLVRVSTAEGVDEGEARALAAGLEAHSAHPIALALREGVTPRALEVIEDETGRGVLGRDGERLLRIGSLDWVRDWHPDWREEATDGTRIYLADRARVLAVFELRDELRPEAPAVVRRFRAQGLRVHLLSGDAEAAVARVAGALGIDDWRARQLPADKLAYVKALQGEGRVVAMVGDGVNDAPVLAAAQVSIAMGGGAHLAQASADMVLLSNHLERIPRAVDKARQTLRIIRQNLTWAIVYNLAALPLAAAGYVPPWLAAIGMSGSSLLVVLNALRLRERHRDRAPRTAPATERGV